MFKRFSSLVVVLALCLTACDEDDADNAAAASSGDPASAGNAATDPAALSDAARFDESMRKKGCDILTPELVAETFSVPKDELKQMKVMGCIYSWKNDDRTVQARLSMIMAHKSEKVAAQWFANATKGVTAEEAQQQVDQAMGKVKDQAAKGELGKGVDEKTVDTVDKAMTGIVGKKGIRYDDVQGVGEEARVNLENGSIWVRVDNLTFSVAAYAGKPMPRVKHDTTDLRKLAAEAQAANRAWMEETFDQRKRDAKKLAKAIVAKL